MNGFDMLDMAIGMVFLFTMVALSASALRELIEGFLKTRAIMIERGIREMLRDIDGDKITKLIYDHPQVSGLFMGDYMPGKIHVEPNFKGWAEGRVARNIDDADKWVGAKRVAFGSHLPAHIPARNFALALLDIAARGGHDAAAFFAGNADKISLDAVRAGIASLPNSTAQRVVLNAIDQADGSVEGAIKSISDWYDGCMEQVRGWYKRQTQTILFCIGLTLAATLNIDAISVMQRLSLNDAWRNAVVEAAIPASAEHQKAIAAAAAAPATGAQVEAPPAALPKAQDVSNAVDDLDSKLLAHGYFTAPNPIFAVWEGKEGARWLLLKAIMGWLITALAAALGAPFWFDVLNKLILARASLKPKAADGSPAVGSGGQAPVDQGFGSPFDLRTLAKGGPTRAVATDQTDFAPHEWKGKKDKQEGVL
jgi:hypothetical protein